METSGTDHSTVADTLGFLGNQRRMLLIGYLSLLDRESAIEVRHLARVIRAIELGTSPRFIDTDDYESAYNALIQTHLPRLESKGLIEYNENRKTVVVRAKLDQYALLVELSRYLLTQ
ncbi:hypothetical protein [Halorubrum sp. F4]|uniref:DUF7344 domain-containing protein n=1 Tax=Halorubrum sp. F4 TaxID=2989715 RepID=UPI0024816084|nr:hypothetical protein [Halorubrum sp. F4]